MAGKLTLKQIESDKIIGNLLIQAGVESIIAGIKEMGFNDKMNFKDTPQRVAKAYEEIFAGIKDTDKQIDNILKLKFPAEEYDQMIICSDVSVFSMCPHHLLPCFLTIDLGYLPSKRGWVIGISKLARIAEILAKRPVLQEILTRDIGKALERMKPSGVMVCIRGEHSCMKIRGVKQKDAFITTSYCTGIFRKSISARNEFFNLIKRGE